MQNIQETILMDVDGYGEGPWAVWRLRGCILNLNLPTHYFWRCGFPRCLGLCQLSRIVHDGQRQRRGTVCQWDHQVHILNHVSLNPTLKHTGSSRRLNNEHLRTNCLHTSLPHWWDLTEFLSPSDSHVTAGHTYFRHLPLQLFILFQLHSVWQKVLTYCNNLWASWRLQGETVSLGLVWKCPHFTLLFPWPLVKVMRFAVPYWWTHG